MAKQKMAKTIQKQKKRELPHKLYVCIAGHVDTLRETGSKVTVYTLNVTNAEEKELRSVPSIYCFNEQPKFFNGEMVLTIEKLKDFKGAIGL
jgi:hypothetical protein